MTLSQVMLSLWEVIKMNLKKVKFFIYSVISVSVIYGFMSTYGVQSASNGTDNINVGAKTAYDLVIPSGRAVGIKIDVGGVMILGFSDVRDENGEKICPAKKSGLKTGDIITSVNGYEVKLIDDLTEITEKSNGQVLTISYTREGKEKTTELTPVYSSEDNEYKMGVWVRDTTSGIGTITYINPKTGEYGALGHPVTDADTGKTIEVGEGNVYPSSVLGINKGSKGFPGELIGMITEENAIGKIDKNNDFGVFGTGDGIPSYNEPVPVASREEIYEGEGTILANIKGNTVEEYKIEIQKIHMNSFDNRGMVIKITDERLLEKTGGIVQGMSGCPILQNGKLAGAVTHVFVNDPTRGYGVFAELMLAKSDM